MKQHISIAEKIARERAQSGWTAIQKEGVTEKQLITNIYSGILKGALTPIPMNMIFPLTVKLLGLAGVTGAYQFYAFGLEEFEFRFFDRLSEAKAQFALRDIPYNYLGSTRYLTMKTPRKLGNLIDDLVEDPNQ